MDFNLVNFDHAVCSAPSVEGRKAKQSGAKLKLPYKGKKEQTIAL